MSAFLLLKEITARFSAFFNVQNQKVCVAFEKALTYVGLDLAQLWADSIGLSHRVAVLRFHSFLYNLRRIFGVNLLRARNLLCHVLRMELIHFNVIGDEGDHLRGCCQNTQQTLREIRYSPWCTSMCTWVRDFAENTHSTARNS